MSNRTVFMIACVIYSILFFAIGWSAKVANMSDDSISRADAIKTAHFPVIDDASYEVVRVDDILALPSAQLAQDLTKGCTDTISRQELLNRTINNPSHSPYITERDVLDCPSAQSDRKKGEWIYGEHDIAMCDGYWCDQCGFFVPWDYKHKFIDFIKDYHWCPSCGADMRGDDHD